MDPIKKEFIWGFYVVLTTILTLISYHFATNDKLYHAIAGFLVGILISLLLWIFFGSKNSY